MLYVGEPNNGTPTICKTTTVSQHRGNSVIGTLWAPVARTIIVTDNISLKYDILCPT